METRSVSPNSAIRALDLHLNARILAAENDDDARARWAEKIAIKHLFEQLPEPIDEALALAMLTERTNDYRNVA